MLEAVLNKYGIFDESTEIKALSSGLINHTWTIGSDDKKFILQRINNKVFKAPNDIAANIRMIGDYLAKHYPNYLFISAEKTKQNEDTVYSDTQGYFRLFPFVKGSHTIDVVKTPEQAFEASLQFGRFSKLLSGFPSERLHITLPDFHNLSLRYQQFQDALQNGNKQRINETAETIDFLKQHYAIVETSKTLNTNSAFRKRVMHHDTKISNVLFDDSDKGICVIDLDTVMPGYFISDVGDMLRTYLSPVSEEESDYSKIEIREEYFTAIASGYLNEMNLELSQVEKDHFVYAGKFMIYMQALRFVTDYLNDDIYYGARYPDHNLVRGINQVVLLKKLIEKESMLQGILDERFV